MLLLKRKTFELENGSPVVKADEAASVATAADIIAAAEAEAAKVAEDAKAAYEAEKARGYADGIEQGRREIMCQKLELVEESASFMERTEQTLADIVVKALKKFVADVGDKEMVCEIVRKSMQTIVRNQRQIRVKVSPEQLENVKAKMQTIQRDFPSLAYVDVVEDTRLSPTACVVETDAGSVEASVEGQLASIESSIRKHFSKEH
ncbi:MAG: HrpE/YscL family type III secretion apparatus protein [Kiritimatiellae bacterium]|nr:HrpE/YscL family type III secretion apparatus protein [Kiritimatiellia bacterium]